jgi:hypothetical protein
MAWTGGYTAHAQQSDLEPVYLMVIAKTASVLDADAGATATTMNMFHDDDFYVPAGNEPMFAYDANAWEIFRPGTFGSGTPPASDTITNCTRGIAGTTPKNLVKGSRVFTPLAFLGTDIPSLPAHNNILQNGSFEGPNDDINVWPIFWTKTTSPSRDTGEWFHGGVSVLMTAGDIVGSEIFSWTAGDDMCISIYGKADSGIPRIGWRLTYDGDWWNHSTQAFQVGSVINTIMLSPVDGSFHRFFVTIPGSAFDVDATDLQVEFQHHSATSNIDAAQVEIGITPTPFSQKQLLSVEIHDYMEFPSGYTSNILYQEGRTETGQVQIAIQDYDNFFTRKLKNIELNGLRAVILGGYRDLELDDYTVLYSGFIRDYSYSQGIYDLNLDAGFDRLNKELYSQAEDALQEVNVLSAEDEDFGAQFGQPGYDGTRGVGTLQGTAGVPASNMTASQTTVTIQGTAGVNDIDVIQSNSSKDLSNGNFAAMYFILGKGTANAEIVRVTSVATSPTYTIVRGQLGTVGFAHGTGTAVDYFFSIQGPPMTVLLYLLLSHTGFETTSSHGTYDLGFGGSGENVESMGLSLEETDINVDAIEQVGEDWFPEFHRYDFVERTKMRQAIEKRILKPIGCNLFVDRTGKISVAAMQPPVPNLHSVTITENDVIGGPTIEFSAANIINNISIEWDYDAFDDSYTSLTRFVDATSQKKYNRDGKMLLDGRALKPSDGGAFYAQAYPEMKASMHAKPAPLIPTLRVPFSVGAPLEPGSVHRLNHARLPDPHTGTVGFDEFVRIVGKRINWRQGTIELSLLTTAYRFSGKVALLADTTQADFTSATQAEKDRYIFYTDSNGKMSDGSDGYVMY